MAEIILLNEYPFEKKRRHIIECVLIYEHPDAVEGDSWT